MFSKVDHHHHNHKGGVTLITSVALLQERFKQLKKMKELRQEQELLRMVSQSDHQGNPTSLQPQSPAFDEHIPATKPLFELSLWPDSQICGRSSGIEFSSSYSYAKSWFVDNCDGDDEIDTSLRL